LILNWVISKTLKMVSAASLALTLSILELASLALTLSILELRRG